MKTLEEIKEEYAVEQGWLSYEYYIGSYDSENKRVEFVINEVANRYASQYQERIKELVGMLRCMLSLSVSQGAGDDWIEIIEAKKLLNKK